MSCGHDDPYLFDTCGGMNEKQIELLYKLLTDKYFIIDKNDEENFYKIYEKYHHEDSSIKPVRINLGYY